MKLLAQQLTGTIVQTIDAKSRLTVPSRFLETFGRLSGVEGTDNLAVVVSLSLRGNMAIFPVPVFERFLEDLQQSAAESPELDEYLTNLLNHCEEQSLDAQNRLKVPQLMLPILMPKSAEQNAPGYDPELDYVAKVAEVKAAERAPFNAAVRGCGTYLEVASVTEVLQSFVQAASAQTRAAASKAGVQRRLTTGVYGTQARTGHGEAGA
ncbi:MAG: hypothetical protein SF028_07055 [Candidatus Sumerlaeia bacterium]|nr:hypothetical protein [Candidatus Sumerlaeia bacterium]